MTENQKLREALRRIKHESASLADAQVIALEALSLPTQAEPVEGGEVDQARFDAGCDVLKYLRQEGAPPRITKLMLVCLHGDPERTDAIRARKDNT